ncbi:MAG: hypothetical protein ACJ786_25845 [Catenulispora sp.]
MPAPSFDLGPLADYDPKMLICRAERHDWPFGGPSDHFWEDVGEDGVFLGWWRELVCRRCKSRLVTTMDLDGYAKSRIKGRPKGYTISRETGRTSKRDARLARVLRQSGSRVMRA